MTELKPGWAEALGRAQAGESECYNNMRRKGRRPFTDATKAQFVAAGIRATEKSHRMQRLERVLGPVTED